MKTIMRQPLSFLIAFIGLSACATPVTTLPDYAPETLRTETVLQERSAMQTQFEKRVRLADIGRPVLAANADLCPKTRRDLGVILHAEEDYPKELRLAASRELGAGEIPSILHVIRGSPAAKAGLKRGDQLWLHDKPVEAGDKRLEKFLEPDRVALMIKRADETVTIAVEPQSICRSHLRYNSSTRINALATGRSITVTRGMLDFTDDDELAMIIGHELAHNMMGHIRKVATNMILSGLAKRYARPFESEADYVGLYFMVRAGYDPTNIEDFWRRLAAYDPRSVNRARTHPTFPDRYLRLKAARDEIRLKQASGEPLIPNTRRGADIFGDDETTDSGKS